MDFAELAVKWKVVGTGTALEKAYLRLTEQPDPATVRPEPVLKDAMKHLLKKWTEGRCEYHFISDQFRAMRQDLVVQHIRNNFTVKVYENNARLSLECHDFGQFNQCLNQLHSLYKEGYKGNYHEFISYRLITLRFSGNKSQFSKQLEELQGEDFESPDIKFALKLVSCVTCGNTWKVFNMYKTGPKLVGYIFDLFILKLRVWALALFSRGFGEKMSVAEISERLAFNEEKECLKFLQETGGTLDDEKKFLILKESIENYKTHELFPKF